MMNRLNKCDSSKTCAYSRYYGQKDITHKRVDHTHDSLNHDLLPALLSSSLSVVMAWYLLCRLAVCCSGCSGLEERSLRTICLTGVLPLRLGVCSCAAGGSAGAAPSEGSAGVVGWAVAGAGCSVGGVVEKKAVADGNWKQRKLIRDVRNTFVSSMCWSCRTSILYSWFLSWRMWMGAASSDWAGGGDGGGVDTDPMGEGGVDCLLSRVAGVAAGVGTLLVAWSACGVAAGLGALPAGATGSGCSEVGRVGIPIWMETTSAISIFRMYSFRVQPDLSGVYLSAAWAGTAAPGDDCVDQHQPCTIYGLVVGGGHQIPLDKCVPQLCLQLQVWAADGFRVLASNISGSAWSSMLLMVAELAAILIYLWRSATWLKFEGMPSADEELLAIAEKYEK
ncbi:hypothetical protein V6N13_007675 [Hibiscus sabdariffa]